MIKDKTTALTKDILMGFHDSSLKIRKAICSFKRDKKNGKIKELNNDSSNYGVVAGKIFQWSITYLSLYSLLLVVAQILKA